MKAKNTITPILTLISLLGFSTSAFCEEEMQLELLWQSPKFERVETYFFDPVQRELRYLMDEKIVIVNSEGKISYERKYNDIIALDRKDSICLFEKGQPLTEIEKISWVKTDLACRKHFSNSMNCFAQFILKKDGKLFLEMYKWDSGKNDYVRKWQSDIPPNLIKTIRSDQRLPDVQVSDQGWMAIKSRQGDFCAFTKHQDTVWIYDSKGTLTNKFFAGDEHFYECNKYDHETKIDQGIIQRIIFSEDGTKLLIQGRSKENVDDQVFLVVDEKGVLLWIILLPCEEIRLIPVFCGSKNWTRRIPSPDGLRNFKTIIFGGKVFRKEPPKLKEKTVDFLTPLAFNKDETKVIYTTKDSRRLILDNLIDGTSRTIFKFNFETPERDVYWNDKEDRIYLKTSNIWRIPIIGDVHYPKVRKSKFRIIDLKGKILYSAEIPGYSSGMKISADERVLFVRSGGQLRLYSINEVRD